MKNISRHIIIFIVGILSLITTSSAQKVGLVLSGGGAKGLYHVGVIKALEENGIPPDFINAPPKLKFATIQVKKWLDCEVLLCQEESFREVSSVLW